MVQYRIYTLKPIPYKIKIVKINERLRAVLVDSNEREICHWWLTNADGSVRYKPFKPAPAIVDELILNKLTPEALEQLTDIMYQVEDGDEIVFYAV